MKNKSVAIIGSGIGGLACAARLSSSGYDVTVFEQSDKPGGKANTLIQGKFRFDTGPSLLTMPFVLEELFEDTQTKLSNYLTLNKLDINCKYFFPDGTHFDAFADTIKLAKEVEQKFDDDETSVIKYLNYSRTIYKLTHNLFLNNSLNELKTFTNLDALKTLLQIFKIDPFRTMHKANSSFFRDERLIQLFDRYATYNGSNPFEAPATLNVIQHVEYNIGGYVPNGGIYEIPKAIYSLCKSKGVQFLFNTKVNGININSKSGVLVEYTDDKGNNDFSNFNIIVSNADVNSTYQNLLKDESSRSSRRYQKLTPSTSALVFYWGINSTFPKLEVHNILFSKNYRKEFQELFKERICPKDPTVYIYISSKYTASDAPDGKENWYVMINAPYAAGQDWNKEVESSRKNIISKIKSILGVDIESKIENESVLTPVDIEKTTSSHRGSLYGISSNSRTAAFLRQTNRSKDYKGLYFCGGSAHPGGGIPLVLLSGKITSELIQKYEQ